MITIEKTNVNTGYESLTFNIEEAAIECNNSLENGQTVFLNGRPFMGDILSASDLTDISNITITNKLTGG